jgi:hypothetical protein
MNYAARQELNALIDDMSSADRAFIAGLGEGALIDLHFGLGLFIRNEIRQNRLPALYKWVRAEGGNPFQHDDDQSDMIITLIWKSLNGS